MMSNQSMDQQRIPLTTIDELSTDESPGRGSLASPMLRANPMIWEGEAVADGIFLGTPADADPLTLLGTPSLTLPPVPRLPEDFRPSAELRIWFEELRAQLLVHAVQSESVDRPSNRLGFASLSPVDQLAVAEILGAGEVEGAVTLDGDELTFKESLLAGVWNVSASSDQWVEVGSIPTAVEVAATCLECAPFAVPAGNDPAAIAAWGSAIMNGPSVLSEVSDRAARYAATAAGAEDRTPNHVINFTLLPITESDQQMLLDVLGRAELSMESGGFGDCRVFATRYRHVWAVQFVNAMGNTILDTLEIGEVPVAVRAQPTDLEDSVARLDNLLEAYLL